MVWLGLGLNPDLPDHRRSFYPLGQASNLGIPNLWSSLNFQNFLFAFWCWLWRSTIITADGICLFSVFRRFQVKVFCWPYPWFLWESFHTQQVVIIFGTSCHCEPLFFKWSMPRVCNYIIITCLIYSFC